MAGVGVTDKLYCVFRPCAGCAQDTLTKLDVIREDPFVVVVDEPPEFVLCMVCSDFTQATLPGHERPK